MMTAIDNTYPVIETERLVLRQLTPEDFTEMCNILQDIEVMYAWEHAFTDEEVLEWMEKNISRYALEGYSYFAAIDKNSQEFVGVMGPLTEDVKDKKYIGIGYILKKEHWNKGYATEGANGCLDYAFEVLKADKVIADIRPGNTSSRKVAERLGMKIEGDYIKHYRGQDMLHLIYMMDRLDSSSVQKLNTIE
jgi:ribosomal-protein-alanine N-acetyltransferase